MGTVVQLSFIPTAESSELAGDIQALFDDLASSLTHEQRAYSGEWKPALDVFESDAAVEVVVDVAGVPPEAIRVLFRAGVLVIAGEKAPALTGPDQTYHLVEREFGRFARAVRLTGAFDIGHSRATVRDGELVVVLPTLPDRRGAAHHIPITGARDGAR